jgi:hypothetical protein
VPIDIRPQLSDNNEATSYLYILRFLILRLILGVSGQCAKGTVSLFLLARPFTHLYPPMASSDQSQENHLLDNSEGQVSRNVVKMDHLNMSTEGTAEFHTPTHPDTAVATSSSSGTLQPTVPTEGTGVAQNSTVEPLSTTEAQIDTLSTEAPAASTSTAPELSRLDSVAISQSTDTVLAPSTPVVNTANPVCIITLLLTSGARHPYKLDEKYLTKRKIEVPGVTESGKKDPFSISVYTLKELILREWREEWEAQPSSPSSIRLIHFGRLLDDKTPLKGTNIMCIYISCVHQLTVSIECRFNADAANVVHMTIKPQEVVDDEEESKRKAMRGDRDGGEGTPGCRCVIL